MAERHAVRHNYRKAAAVYREILALDPQDIHSRQKLAENLMRAGDVQGAREAYLIVAAGFSRRGFDLKAIGVLRVLLAQDPHDIEVNERLVEAFLLLNLTGDAIARLHVLAEIYEAKGDLATAVKKREQIEKIAPQDILNALKLGETLQAKGAAGESTEVYKQVLTQVGKKTTSTLPYVKVAERLLEIGHEDAAISRRVAQVLLDQGDTSTALEWLERSQKLAPHDLETLTTFAQLFKKSGHDKKYQAVQREIERLAAPVDETKADEPPRDSQPMMELTIDVVEDLTPAPVTPPPVTLPESRTPPTAGVQRPAPLRPRVAATSVPPPIPADALSTVNARRLTVEERGAARTAPTALPHRASDPPPVPSSAMSAIIDKELNDAFSVAFRSSEVPPAPGERAQKQRGDSAMERSSPSLAPISRPAKLSPTPLPSIPEEDEIDVRAFESVVKLPANLLPAEESFKPGARGSRVPPAEAREATKTAAPPVQVRSTPVRPDSGDTIRRDLEVERILSGVRTMLEFDIVDKALRLAEKALELAPEMPQVRELHKLAVYRAGRAAQRDAGPEMKVSNDPTSAIGGENE